MDSEIKQRLIGVIGWGGYCAAAVCFFLGATIYLNGNLRAFGERWDDVRHGLPLMFWGVGLFIVTAAALYVIDGRTPVSRETPAKLLSPSTPYWKFALLALAVAPVGFAIAELGARQNVEIGVSLMLLGVLFAVLFAVMAVVVKRR